jgi:class 3 adenylate cyclase
MPRLEALQTPEALEILVALSHLAGSNKKFVMQNEDRLVFDSMQKYFFWAGALIQKSHGKVIKCMGDAILMAFEAEYAEDGIFTLRRLKSEGDAWLQEAGIPCQHLIKAHFGPVMAGYVGAPGQEQFDIFGKTVNICFTMESFGLVLSSQAFRCLGPEGRKYFKKHSEPISYIRQEDAH